MARYLIERLLAAVPTLLALTLVAFLLTTAARGDPALEALQQAGERAGWAVRCRETSGARTSPGAR